MIGSDLFNQNEELNEWAVELLNEDMVENFLSKNDFVFMMHQGYMFWYFEANGNENPDVFFYNQGSMPQKNIGSLKIFIRKYPL